jgi:hypothetical protein
VFEDVARARARESALLRQHGHSCAAVYLAGYVVECRLKTLLDRQGKKFSRSGTVGHDLVGLWDAAGLRFRALVGSQAGVHPVLENRLEVRGRASTGG